VAEAKLCVRISAPATVAPGEAVPVSVTTLMPTSWATGLRPIGLRPFPATTSIRIAVLGPNAYREVVLRRTKRQPSVSTATIRLATVGTWRLSVIGWDFAPPRCAPKRLVRVVRSPIAPRSR
jgi:hypothetical protein